MTFPLSLSSSFSSSLTRVLSFTTKPTHYRAILENENRPEQSSRQREKERDWRKRVLFCEGRVRMCRKVHRWKHSGLWPLWFVAEQTVINLFTAATYFMIAIMPRSNTRLCGLVFIGQRFPSCGAHPQRGVVGPRGGGRERFVCVKNILIMYEI
jgi:hypothetical protein